MDDKRFDDLSRVLATSLTRSRLFKVFTGIGATGLATLAGLSIEDAEAKKKKGKGSAQTRSKRKAAKGKGKGKKKGKAKNKSQRNAGGQKSSAQDASVTALDDKLCPGNQDKVCHCPPGNPSNCQTTGNGAGHSGHNDCCCTINGAPNPDCECPSGEGNYCCKPEGTSCEFDQNCCADAPYCCGGVCQATQCECTTNEQCDDGNPCTTDKCVNNKCEHKPIPGCCTSSDQCNECQKCEGNQCVDKCGPCQSCENGTCVDTCGPCQKCQHGKCVDKCAPCQDCQDGTCIDTCTPSICVEATCKNGSCDRTKVETGNQGPECQGEGKFCCTPGDIRECCTSPQVCKPGKGCCLPDGVSAGGANECCSGKYCQSTGTCGSCTCSGSCQDQQDCAGRGGEDCVCLGLSQGASGTCGACIDDGLPAESAAECCSGDYCAEEGICGECPPVICEGTCNGPEDCSSKGDDCVCVGATDQTSGTCQQCVDDGQPAESAAECCSGNYCASQGLCGLCPPQTCAGSCASSPTICQTHAPDCICSTATLACQTCVTVGGACRATDECCGNEVCINGICGFKKSRRRSKKPCVKHGRACTKDAQCCGQASCYKGRCGEKDTHCHHDRECAKGYSCEGGRSIGSHRRCRKKNSNRGRRKIRRRGGHSHR